VVVSFGKFLHGFFPSTEAFGIVFFDSPIRMMHELRNLGFVLLGVVFGFKGFV